MSTIETNNESEYTGSPEPKLIKGGNMPKINQDIATKDNVTLTVYDKDGNIKEQETVHNLMTDVGLANIAFQVGSSAAAAATAKGPGFIQLGTGSGQGASSTKLASYLATSAKTVTSFTSTNKVLTITYTYAANDGAVGAVTEAGLFHTAGADNASMLCYTSFTVKNIGVTDTFAITWTWTFS